MASHANHTVVSAAPFKASEKGTLGSRSLAVLLASPSTSTVGTCRTASDSSDDTRFGDRDVLKQFSSASKTRVVHDESSTDTGEGAVLYESSTDESEYESDQITPSIQEESSCAESGNESCSFRVAHSRDASSDSEIDDHRGSVLPFIYPLTILLQYRAAVILQNQKPSSSVCYGTASVDELSATKSQKQNAKTSVPAFGLQLQPCVPPSATIDEKLAKSVRTFLNDLTVGNACTVYEKITARGIRTPAQLAVVTFEVFQKAAVHHQLIPTCVDFCLQFKSDSRVQAAIGSDGGPQSFRQILLDQCWPSFEHLICSNESIHCVCQSLDVSHKKQVTGYVKLIAELVMRDILSPRLLVECAEVLLRRQTMCVDLLEPTAALLLVIGPKFCVQSDWAHSGRLEIIFDKIQEFSHDEAIPLHIRLVLREVLSLKASGWRRCGTAPALFSANATDEPQHKAESELAHPLDGLCQMKSSTQPAEEKPKPPAKPPQSMLNLARSALLSPVDPAPRLPPKPQGTSSNPAMSLKKALRTEPKSPAGTLADSPAGAMEQLPQSPKVNPTVPASFDPVAFHKELSAILRDLSATGDVSAAIHRVHVQNVPTTHQAQEYVDLLTRASESRPSARRAAFAFVAGLAAECPGVFDRAKCLGGISEFFVEVYEDLRDEVPQLPTVVQDELLPALRVVFPQHTLDGVLPEEF